MPVLGASNPDLAAVWHDPPQRKIFPNRLASYFVYHAKSSMSVVYGEREWLMLAKTFNDLRRSGYADQDIRRVVDTFYIQWDRKSHPAYVFATDAVRNRLLAPLRPSIKNPVYRFIANGLYRSDDPLPWDESCDAELRRSVMLYGNEMAYRYPDVLMTLLVTFGDSPGVFDEQVKNVNDLIVWKTSPHVERLQGSKYVNKVRVALPHELESYSRSSDSIRPPAPTLEMAVARTIGRKSRALRNANGLEE